MKRRITLIIPNSRWFEKRPWLSFPYSALILSAILKDKYEFSILDANGQNLDEEGCRKRLSALSPHVVMVTGGSVEYHRPAHLALAVAKQACPEAITIMGGVYPTTLPENAVKDVNADWIFMYHAEERIVPFLELLFAGDMKKAGEFPGIAFLGANGALVENPVLHYIADVGKMVKPDYELVDLNPYLKQTSLDYQFNSDKPSSFIISSYGCPYNCSFCASRTISGRKIAYRPAEDVLEEIGYLRDKYGVRNLVFLDDSLLSDRGRIAAILNGLIKRKYGLTWKSAAVNAGHLNEELLQLMKRSGCIQLTISVESGSQRVLEEVIHKPFRLNIVPGIVKKCRELGIALGANFVIGSPGETWDEIRQTFKFAEECDFDVAHFHIATPLPRTNLYRVCVDKGYLPKDFSFTDPKFFGFGYGFITTDEFTPVELSVLRTFEWDRINFSTPEKVKRVAKLYNTTIERLKEHRRSTRRKFGIHFSS